MMNYSEYVKKHWNKAAAVVDLLEYRALLADLKVGKVRPSRIVGTGYKYPRKAAEDWLNSQIKMIEQEIKTDGESSSTMRANYEVYKRSAK